MGDGGSARIQGAAVRLIGDAAVELVEVDSGVCSGLERQVRSGVDCVAAEWTAL